MRPLLRSARDCYWQPYCLRPETVWAIVQSIALPVLLQNAFEGVQGNSAAAGERERA